MLDSETMSKLAGNLLTWGCAVYIVIVASGVTLILFAKAVLS